jgi:molecular chaperone DnaJ
MDYNRNYYKELDIDKNATEDDIKKQFRKLAMQYHPDKNNGNKESELKFQKINEANSILSDANLRQEYDTRSPNGRSYSPFEGFNSGFEFHFGGGPEDIFNQFFGVNSPFRSGFNPFGNQREEFREILDINISTTVNLKNIYLNDNLDIKFKKFVYCDDCKGTGFDKTSHSEICEICNGIGINKGRTCEYCQGEGKIYTGQCKTCKGEKVILQDSNVTLQNLSQLRNTIKNVHRGYGHQSKYYRDKIGSLILNINVDRNDKYEIINNFELLKTIDIHFQDAIDGNEITYHHIDDNKIKIKLPIKTKNNDIITIKEKGLLKNDNTRADLYLKINIIIDYERI